MDIGGVRINRRALFAGAAATVALSGAGALPAAAQGAAPAAEPPRVRTIKLGGLTVHSVQDGAMASDGPYPIFGADQSAEAVADLLQQNFLPPTRTLNGFTPALVDTGADKVLFDTGLGGGAGAAAGNLVANLAALGVQPGDVTVVALTHLHPDHIGGLMTNGAPTFPNARYVVDAAEYDFWTKQAPADMRKGVEANVVPLADKATFIKDGDSVVAGITAMAAPGHTPGHTAFMLESEGRRLLITGDVVNHYVISFQRPDWALQYDNDKAAAAATRRRVLGMLAADRTPFIGYHMPFPGIGYVEPAGDAFRYVPATYQFDV